MLAAEEVPGDGVAAVRLANDPEAAPAAIAVDVAVAVPVAVVSVIAGTFSLAII